MLNSTTLKNINKPLKSYRDSYSSPNYIESSLAARLLGRTVPGISKVLLLTIISLIILSSNVVKAVTFPLSSSADKNYLVDANGTPFFIHGDTRWFLLKNSWDNVITYLNNRQNKKVNTIMADFIGYESFASNGQGQAPFNNGNVGSPNEAYFKYAEDVFNASKDRGIVLILYISVNLLGDENSCRNFGQYIGNRFKNQPNLIFSIGYGDKDLSGWKSKIQAVAEGILSNRPGTLITSQGAPGQSSRDYLGTATYHTLNGLYCYYPTFEHGPNHQVYGDFYDEAFKSPDMPAFLLESRYEGAQNAPLSMIRRQGWWTLLSGGTGHIYGHENVWGHLGGHTSHYDAEGAKDMQHLIDFVSSIKWHTLVPDRNNSVVTGGYGTKNTGTGSGGDDYITTAISSDSKTIVSYIPSTGTGTRTITLNMSRLSGSATARWYNPTNGQFSTISGSPFSNSGTRQFTTPGNNGNNSNDWVLILDTSSGGTTTTTPTPTPTPVPGTVDLIVTDISWSPSNPVPGSSVTFSATIKNQGSVASPNGVIHGVAFSINGTVVNWSDNSSESLAAGASRTVTASGGPNGSSMWTATNGSHTIEAFVDDINRITGEGDENNNKRQETITVSTATPTPTVTPTPTPTPTATPQGGGGTGLKGEYFDNTDFTSLKVTRTDATINFSWGSGAPASGVGADTFSVRWTGQVEAPATGTYTFITNSDDGVRLWVNGTQLVNNWTNHGPTENSGNINLTAGQKYSIRMEYYENAGGAVIQLSWIYPGQTKQIIPQSRLYEPASTGGGGTGGITNGRYRLTAKHSGKVMEVADGLLTDGGNVQQWSYANVNQQKWNIESIGDGYYKITAVHSGKALDVASKSTSDGANIHQWSYGGGSNQQWKIESLGNGYYRIVSRNSGKCVDVSGPSTADGANVHQWTCHGGDNQAWKIETVQ
jgi:hypothetical protein